MVQKWLKQAEGDSWDEMRKENSFTPTRLLKLNTESVSSIQLVVTAETDKKEPYATLSHCWGPNQPLQLLKNNFDDMKDGILIASLLEPSRMLWL
jgi:hypothetical protein